MRWNCWPAASCACWTGWCAARQRECGCSTTSRPRIPTPARTGEQCAATARQWRATPAWPCAALSSRRKAPGWSSHEPPAPKANPQRVARRVCPVEARQLVPGAYLSLRRARCRPAHRAAHADAERTASRRPVRQHRRQPGGAATQTSPGLTAECSALSRDPADDGPRRAVKAWDAVRRELDAAQDSIASMPGSRRRSARHRARVPDAAGRRGRVAAPLVPKRDGGPAPRRRARGGAARKGLRAGDGGPPALLRRRLSLQGGAASRCWAPCVPGLGARLPQAGSAPAGAPTSSH